MASKDSESEPADEKAQSWRGGIGMGLRNRFGNSKFLNKKFANTSRFVVSSQVWMHTIPTRDCDILLTFPAATSDATLMWLLARLRQRTPELAVHVRHHSNTGVYGFYLTATHDNLLRGAEEIAIRKPVKKDFGGGMKEFIFDEQEYFDGADDTATFLTSQERQAIVKHMLYNLRAIEGDALNKIKFLEGQAIVPVLLSKGIAKGVLPIHNADDLKELRKTWVQAFLSSQPLDKINEYFGVKIAMYFAYLGHYTKALIFPAILGAVLWLFSRKVQAREDVVFVIFSFINVVWSTLYLEDWKRKSAEKAYHWGTLDREDDMLMESRPLYHGHPSRSPITGRIEPSYPAWKRTLFRYFVSGPIILSCISVVFVTMWWIFQLQDWVNDRIKIGEFPFWCKFLPKILLALCIGILDDIYKKIANWLNDKENYRLEESYENNLIIKLILFQFINSYLSLFYIAFYLQDMERLKDQLAALLITRQVIGNIKEALVPYVIEKAKLFRIGYNMAGTLSPDTLDRQAQQIIEQSQNGHQNGSKPVETSLEQDKTSSEQVTTGSETDKTGSDPVKTGSDKDSSGTEPDKTGSGEGKEVKESSEKGSGEIQEENGMCGVNGDGESFEDGKAAIIQHSGPHLTQAEVEGAMKKYEDTFEDYLEMLIQFGYVTLFSSAFPMAAMCALLNNIIEIRSDAFKLCLTFQRPFGQRVENIGGWQDALEIMSVIAIMVNCALIGMSGLANRFFPGLSTAERIVFIVILEHVILVARVLLAYAIPDTPQWVAEEKARLEFYRREALKRLETVANSAPSSPATSTSPDSPHVITSKTSPLTSSTPRTTSSSLGTASSAHKPASVTVGSVGSAPRSACAAHWSTSSSPQKSVGTYQVRPTELNKTSTAPIGSMFATAVPKPYSSYPRTVLAATAPPRIGTAGLVQRKAGGSSTPTDL